MGDQIEKMIELEWKQFDKVQNIGGRASCQDDRETFRIMRKSQFDAWSEELCASYYEDLLNAGKAGRNLLTEKYARMMASTDPQGYEAIRTQLPEHDPERIAIEEAIIAVQVEWMEKFAGKYPKTAGTARRIHTYEDELTVTSYETYLRGELGTYSDQTLELYKKMIDDLQMDGKNLAYHILDNTARMYGYASIDDAERAQDQKRD